MDKKNFYSLIVQDLRRIHNTSGRNNLYLFFVIFKYILVNNAFRAIFFSRLINSKFWSKFKPLKYFIIFVNTMVNFRFKVPYNAKIGGGLNIPHPECIIINDMSVIGENATILQGVTIGRSRGKFKGGTDSPIIGNNVFIGAGAKVLGPINIGDNCMIGANAVVTKDFSKNSIIVGIPAKIIGKTNKPFIEIQKDQFNL